MSGLVQHSLVCDFWLHSDRGSSLLSFAGASLCASQPPASVSVPRLTGQLRPKLSERPCQVAPQLAPDLARNIFPNG